MHSFGYNSKKQNPKTKQAQALHLVLAFYIQQMVLQPRYSLTAGAFEQNMHVQGCFLITQLIQLFQSSTDNLD